MSSVYGLDEALEFGKCLTETPNAVVFKESDLFVHIRALYSEVKRLQYLIDNQGTCGCWRNDPNCSRCF
jgi:hypothetical protein